MKLTSLAPAPVYGTVTIRWPQRFQHLKAILFYVIR
jgi:hypothetical protein